MDSQELFIPFGAACVKLGNKKSKMYDAIRNEPGHPQPVKRSGRNYFLLSELLAYMEKKVKERDATPRPEHPAPWTAIEASRTARRFAADQHRGKAQMQK